MACSDTTRWTENLPLVLLGLRTTFKADLGCFVAELVYGTTLKLPADLVQPIDVNALDPSNFVHCLRSSMRELHFTATRAQTNKRYIPKDLTTCSHVWLRNDAVRRPLQPPYEGPFEVIARTAKHHMINRNGKVDVLSVDRLKPAYIEQPCEQKSTASKTPFVGRSHQSSLKMILNHQHLKLNQKRLVRGKHGQVEKFIFQT
ncbi:unnamed protein product, partial [Dicrocoelium dendriticum]